MNIREIHKNELEDLLRLYTQLHSNQLPADLSPLKSLWKQIICDQNHHIVVAEENGEIISSCVCVVVPNLTHEQRPYALIENVITDKDYRHQGLATACLDFAKEIAVKNNCYKIMLLTGSKQESTLNFYRKAGYNSEDKTAFIQWL